MIRLQPDQGYLLYQLCKTLASQTTDTRPCSPFPYGLKILVSPLTTSHSSLALSLIFQCGLDGKSALPVHHQCCVPDKQSNQVCHTRCQGFCPETPIEYFFRSTCQKMTTGRLETCLSCKGCSSREHGLGSQHPHEGSQPSDTPVPGNPAPSSGPCRHQACTQYTYILTNTTLILIKSKYIF